MCLYHPYVASCYYILKRAFLHHLIITHDLEKLSTPIQVIHTTYYKRITVFILQSYLALSISVSNDKIWSTPSWLAGMQKLYRQHVPTRLHDLTQLPIQPKWGSQFLIWRGSQGTPLFLPHILDMYRNKI